MKASRNKFLLILVAITLVLATTTWLVIKSTGINNALLPFAMGMIGLTFVTTLISGQRLLASDQAKSVIRASMASTVIKFFVNLVFLFIAMYISGDKELYKGIVAVFFIAYMVYTIFEKWFVIKELRN